jgi:hypothetical protein
LLSPSAGLGTVGRDDIRRPDSIDGYSRQRRLHDDGARKRLGAKDPEAKTTD